MSEERRLEDHWRKAGPAVQGGAQADSYPVESLDGHQQGFAKVLKRSRNEKARGRFFKEVSAYKTLVTSSVPRLLDENADEWNRSHEKLYMVMELIDGCTLDDRLRSDGPISLVQALDLCRRLLLILNDAHAQDIVHRDVKPRNIMLQGGQLATPVLLDFGLMFTKADEATDLTVVGEEVGNRFFRLPEHALGGRSPVSDITQCFGVLLFAVTGVAPQVLADGAGAAPHQREPFSGRLTGGLSDAAELHLKRLLDRAFAPRIDDRVQTVPEAIVGIERVLRVDQQGEDVAVLEAQVRALVMSPALADTEAARRVIDGVLTRIAAFTRDAASSRQLQYVQSGHSVSARSSPPSGVTHVALFDEEIGQPDPIPSFGVTIVGGEVALTFGDDPVWRESSGTDLGTAVVRALLNDYLSRHHSS